MLEGEWQEVENKGKMKLSNVSAHLQGLNAILSLIFLGRLDKVAVVAALLQLHHNV